MARTRRTIPQDPQEIPLEPKPRRKKSPKGVAAVLEELKAEYPALQVAADLPPATFAEKVRPTGPRKRDPSDAAAIFASDDLRVTKDGHMYQAVANRDLTGDEKDFIAKQGLTPVDDEERVFNGSVRDVLRAEGDVNLIGFKIGKGEGRGR